MSALPTQKTTFDLTTIDGIRKYFDGTEYAADSVELLSGGSANFSYRIKLQNPLPNGFNTVVVKHAQAYAALAPEFILDLNRTDVEQTVMKAVLDAPSLLDGKVTVPRPLAYDAINRVQIFEDAGALLSIKDFLIKYPTADELARELGQELGRFLSKLHKWGKTLTKEQLKPFRDNQAARDICALRVSGRLKPIAEEFGVEGDWETIGEKMKQDILASDEDLNMGDFWTGNILVKTTGSEPKFNLDKLYVLDWEVAKLGPYSTDVAQFAAEAYLLERFNAPSAGRALLSSFLTTYKAELPVSSADVLLHLSGHVAVFGHLTGWGKNDVADRNIAFVESLNWIKSAATGVVPKDCTIVELR